MGADTPAAPDAGAGALEAALTSLFAPNLVTACAAPVLQLDALHPEERSHVATAVPKRQAEFSTGRVCAHRALRELGASPAPLLPGPQRAPAWPAGMVGSISHTGSCCAVVVGSAPPWLALGLDVESAEPLDAKLEQRVCTAEERGWLSQQDPGARGALAKILFSAKEAVYKCQHPRTGVFLGFQDVQLRVDPEAGSFDAEIRSELGPEHAALRRLSGRFARAPGLVLSGLAVRT